MGLCVIYGIFSIAFIPNPILNYGEKLQKIMFDQEILSKAEFENQTVFKVTSDDLQSSKIFINGVQAMFPDDPMETPNVLKYGVTRNGNTVDF